MDPIREKILEICLATDLEGIKLVRALETEIAKFLPYNHDLRKDDFKACGLESDHIKLGIEMPRKASMSQVVETIESLITKRELCVAFFKQLVDSGIAEEVDEDGRRISHEDDSDSLEHLARELMGQKPSDQELKDLIDLLKGEEIEDDEEFPKDPSRCRQEDNSECWNCPHKKICTRFK